MTLEDAIVYYSETAKECRRKARIESNDYMDMKDRAYEAEQLADWLNELKVLRGRMDAHPEIKEIDYSQCADAVLKMWIDKVVTDGEYYRIMDKLNVYWAERWKEREDRNER